MLNSRRLINGAHITNFSYTIAPPASCEADASKNNAKRRLTAFTCILSSSSSSYS